MSYRLGINLGFAINKYIEPEVWSDIVAEDLGLHYVQMVADLLNPFWDEPYLKDQVRRIKRETARKNITVESMFTSAFTRVNHLMNPDEQAREMWLRWFNRFLELGSEFGARNIGSHFGIMTFPTYNDEQRREFILNAAIEGWQKLSFRAKELGYSELIFEPMSVPREMGNTIARAKYLMERVNENCGVPMKFCLDVGHAPDPSERDPYLWVSALAAQSPVIHLQQTVLNKSNHSPFTEEYNRDGIIQREKLMDCVREAGCTDALFAFEISHREHCDFEDRIIPDLKASVDYFREVVSL